MTWSKGAVIYHVEFSKTKGVCLMDQKRDGNKNHVQSHHPLLTCCSLYTSKHLKNMYVVTDVLLGFYI